MTVPSIVRPGRSILPGLPLAVAVPPSAQVPKPFAVPRDGACWEARREGLRRGVAYDPFNPAWRDR